MERRWRWIAVAGCVVALAYWAGKHQGASSTGTPMAAPPAPTAAARPIIIEKTTAGADGLSREELRAIVREELAARGEPAPVEQPEDPERAAAVAQAQDTAARVVESGIADGVWSAQERDALRAQLPRLGERETHAVLTPLFQAINAQRLQLDGPPI